MEFSYLAMVTFVSLGFKKIAEIQKTLLSELQMLDKYLGQLFFF